MNKEKIKYFLRSFLNINQKKECPYCNSTNLINADRKFIITQLLYCSDCNLLHRHPKDTLQDSANFYQEDYKVVDLKDEIMTHLPSDEEIKKSVATNFSNQRSYDKYLLSLLGYRENIRILDFGCSWGYNVLKLRNEGYDSEGFEISKKRAAFGEKKLNVKIFSDLNLIPSNYYDVIFSSHVIEHLPDIKILLRLSKRILKKNGYFIAFCPYGNNEYKEREPDVWHSNWGLLHPNYLSTSFAKQMFFENPHILLTGDWSFDINEINNWDKSTQYCGNKIDGKELLIISRPNILI